MACAPKSPEFDPGAAWKVHEPLATAIFEVSSERELAVSIPNPEALRTHIFLWFLGPKSHPIEGVWAVLSLSVRLKLAQNSHITWSLGPTTLKCEIWRVLVACALFVFLQPGRS